MGARRRLQADAPPGHRHRQGAPAPDWSAGYLNGWLSQPTPVFGLRLWVLIGIAVGAAIVLVLLLIFVCLSRRRRRRRLAANPYYPADTKLLKKHLQQQATPTPTPTKDIQEIVRRQQEPAVQLAKAVPQPQPQPQTPPPPPPPPQHRPPARKTPGSGVSATTSGGSERDGATPRSTGSGAGLPEVSHLGWGHWFTLRELEEATGGLAEENVIGEGGYGIVYKGTLHDSTLIAVKNLLNNRYAASGAVFRFMLPWILIFEFSTPKVVIGGLN
jgi:hypothetical protein